MLVTSSRFRPVALNRTPRKPVGLTPRPVVWPGGDSSFTSLNTQAGENRSSPLCRVARPTAARKLRHVDAVLLAKLAQTHTHRTGDDTQLSGHQHLSHHQ